MRPFFEQLILIKLAKALRFVNFKIVIEAAAFFVTLLFFFDSDVVVYFQCYQIV